MSDETKKFYLTTPIYYVNARPHIGHAYTTIVADVLARRHRLLGDDTYFLTGTDEHGQKIERSAAAAGVPPQQFADEVSASFEGLWKRMGITYDQFIRTTSDKHKLGVQKLFADLYEKGFIYLASYTGSYCVSDEAFVDVPSGNPCPDCGRITETITEENFFFRLSAFQESLVRLIDDNQLLITPGAVRNEVLSFVRGNVASVFGPNELRKSWANNPTSFEEMGQEAVRLGRAKEYAKGKFLVFGALKDLSISRSSFSWGIPVPQDVQEKANAKDKHVIYVWLDALTNYITALGYGTNDADPNSLLSQFWPANIHLVGKEITRFHCVYWPAFLLAAGLDLPKRVTAHGWLLFDNSKMSKSKGNIVRTETILDAFGDEVYGKQFPDSSEAERDLFASDVLRYFLLREIPFGQDGSFTFDALITRYNADLANGYGNFVSRVLSMIERYCEGRIPEAGIERLTPFGDSSNVFDWDMLHLFDSATYTSGELDFTEYEALDFNRRLIVIMGGVSVCDSQLTQKAPWKLITESSLKDSVPGILREMAESIRIITALLYPVLPYATAKVWAQLGLGDIELAARNGELNKLQWGGLKPGTKLGPLAPIFPRADKGLTQIMTDMEDSKDSQLTSSKLETQQDPASTDPGAPPRSGTGGEQALTVGGSAATTTRDGLTPSHTEAAPSGVFASTASQTPITAAGGDEAPQITIDDFAKIELRVAQIVVAERIPKADKLLRLEVDLGAHGKRQILSGIAEFYTPEELVGRRIVVITNLAPRKMRGLESHGMLLAASDTEGGKPALATCGEEIALGARLK